MSSKIGRNEICHCGSGKKYKRCCIGKKTPVIQKRIIKRSDLISGPYKKCPNPLCLIGETFGVFMAISGSNSYTRECVLCGYKENYKLPPVKKVVVYLDQFVISNLLKLLDTSHKSHAKIKLDPFWKELFIKLEAGIRSQAIVCVDSFYHRDESLVGEINFELMKRLYEHFSGGKTLYPSALIQQQQITAHFEGWITKKQVAFDLSPQSISSEDLDTWIIGLGISVGGKPYLGEIESLISRNNLSREQIKDIWATWKLEKNVTFINRVRHETTGLFKGLMSTSASFAERSKELTRKAMSGEHYEIAMEDILPPFSNDLFNALQNIARAHRVSEEEIPKTVVEYFSDIDSLLEVPQVKIGSVMYAGLARSAALGKIEPPKSLNDVVFISSYLPYCDAMLVDIESQNLIKSLPQNTPTKLRLNEYVKKVFSLRDKERFLEYLDNVIQAIPNEQTQILKDLNGENYAEPYWDIIKHEKISLSRKD